MGSWLSRKPQHKVLVVGLDYAGKTTLLNNLNSKELNMITPTVGFNFETTNYQNLEFISWDLGLKRLCPLWKHYYPNTEGIILVVDSSNIQEIDFVKQQIWKMLNDELLKDAILLVFANKKDIAVINTQDIVQRLGLNQISNRQWFIYESCANKGEGIKEGIQWLIKAIERKK